MHILLYLRIGVCVVVINDSSFVSCPVLTDFLLNCVVIRLKISSPRLPIPRSIAHKSSCYVYMPLRAMYLYAEPIVELLFAVFVFLLRHPPKFTRRAHFLLTLLFMAS